MLLMLDFSKPHCLLLVRLYDFFNKGFSFRIFIVFVYEFAVSELVFDKFETTLND